MMWFCDTCNRRFRRENDCAEHMDQYGHWNRYPCETCDRQFVTEGEAEFHMLVTRHYSNYCFDCDRVFSNENALRMHLNSSIHREENNFCPFCGMGYSTPSGVYCHLESGSCHNAPSLNRVEVHLKIERADPHGLITDKHITTTAEPETPEGWIEWTRGGDHFECPLCQRLFRTATSLIQHLNSPAHQQRLYHCPNKDQCPKQFNSLAGMCAHLESGSCGFMGFGQVRTLQKQLNRALQGNWSIRI